MADQLGEQNQNSGLVLHAYRGLGQKELYDHLGYMKKVETIVYLALLADQEK